MRINQFLARSGIASRRKAELLVSDGRVQVNGKVEKDLATNIIEDQDIVKVDGQIVGVAGHKYYILNKPLGYVTTKSDPHATRTVFELMPEDNSLIAVGRLDKQTTGLLIFTNDGQFAQNIIHPSRKIEKEYYVKTLAPATDSQLEALRAGVLLEDGPAITNSLTRVSEKEIILVIEEGRNRIVRRMIGAVGNEVEELERRRIGSIKLDIKTGEFRELSPKEVKEYA